MSLAVETISPAIERVFREEYGRALSVLIGATGDLDAAEDALQEALLIALERWPRDRIPANPAGWLVTVARRKAIDRYRQEARFIDPAADVTALPQPLDDETDVMDEPPIPDERLKLIFTCCHPALAPEAQVALTLRTLGGLSTDEIARAFLVPVPTMNQRLTRAKAKIRQAGIPYIVPPPSRIPERLDAVLNVLYLIFNEGYDATSGSDLIRHDLCAESIRLARALVGLLASRSELGEQPEVTGLLALMLLHDARRPARQTSGGALVLLEDQDRSQWDHRQIAEGITLLERALAVRRPGPYQIQAAISAVHAEAPTAAETDWQQIAALYDVLLRITPSPVVALNRAVAVGMADGPLAALRLLDDEALAANLAGYHWYHAARADFLRRAGFRAEAVEAYTRALALCRNERERTFLAQRVNDLT